VLEQRLLRIAMLALASTALTADASAAEIVHFYQAFSSVTQSTPEFQGWALNPGTTAGTHVPKGAASPYYAWRVTDSISAPQSFNPGYASEVGTHPAWTNALAKGWRYTATARYLTAAGQGPNVGLTAYVNNREYNLLLNLNSSGVLQARLHDESPATFTLPIAAGSSNDFHEFQLRSVPGTARVQLYVDNALASGSYAWDGVSNTTHAIDTVHWGNSSRAGAALGMMDFHKLTVDVGPFATLAADFNEDTFVNRDDLDNWMNGVGMNSATHQQGDADGDADVDGADFLVWQRQIGSAAVATQVPEPAGIGMIVVAAAAIVAAKRRALFSLIAGCIAATTASGSASPSAAAEIAVQPTDSGAAVTIDGQCFADYLTRSGHQPVVWPVIGPGGQTMTRQYPLGPKLPGEEDDHPHHRSLWFNHGSVNGLDFWAEPNLDAESPKSNQIEHREFVERESRDGVARIVARNDWTSNGAKICEDVRTFTFGADEHGRWIDVDIVLTASEGELVLGDTKEGCFGLRVAGAMAVDAKQGGRILNSGGQTDEAAWGRAAAWVDYHGVLNGEPAGIAVFDMPDSFRHPGRWHVRTYGLFAANPIGERDFPPGDEPQGAVTLANGESLRFHYRVLLYAGDLTAEQLTSIGRKYGQSGGEEAK
jgi:hypothetical protein